MINNISYLRHSEICSIVKNSFGEILRKFDANWTLIIDDVCVLSFMPKISIFYAILQILRREQHCEFCHIESRCKNNVKSLIKLQST